MLSGVWETDSLGSNDIQYFSCPVAKWSVVNTETAAATTPDSALFFIRVLSLKLTRTQFSSTAKQTQVLVPPLQTDRFRNECMND